MKVDELTKASRDFYERSLLKLTYSLMFGALGMMLLGFCASTGAKSTAGAYAAKSSYYKNYATTQAKDALQAKIGSFGFACFIMLVGFFVVAAVVIYISPLRASEK